MSEVYKKYGTYGKKETVVLFQSGEIHNEIISGVVLSAFIHKPAYVTFVECIIDDNIIKHLNSSEDVEFKFEKCRSINLNTDLYK